MRIRQSFCHPIFAQHGAKVAGTNLPDTGANLASDVELFEFARSVGYEATEFWGPTASFRDQVAAAKSAGLKVASFTAHESIEHGFNDESQHERIFGELETYIAMAKELEIPGIIVFSGGRNGSQSDLEGLLVAAKGLRQIVPVAEAAGVTLNLEILNSRVNHPGYMADTVEWGVALCDMVASPNLKILFDIYHIAVMQGDLITRLRTYMPYIGHIHTAGCPGRHEMDDSQELNYRGICSAIADSSYSGFVGHEFFPAKLSKRDSLVQAFEICNV